MHIEFDERLFTAINQACSGDVASLVFSFFTGLGNGWVLLTLIVPSMFFFSRQKFRTHFLAMLLTVAVGGVLVSGIKKTVQRERPPAVFAQKGVEVHTPLGIPTDWSFPSGHAETAFATAVFLCLLYPSLSPLFLFLAAAVAFSRIAVGVHFPVDVLAGAILGTLNAFAGFYINRLRLARRTDLSSDR